MLFTSKKKHLQQAWPQVCLSKLLSYGRTSSLCLKIPRIWQRAHSFHAQQTAPFTLAKSCEASQRHDQLLTSSLYTQNASGKQCEWIKPSINKHSHNLGLFNTILTELLIFPIPSFHLWDLVRTHKHKIKDWNQTKYKLCISVADGWSYKQNDKSQTISMLLKTLHS